VSAASKPAETRILTSFAPQKRCLVDILTSKKASFALHHFSLHVAKMKKLLPGQTQKETVLFLERTAEQSLHNVLRRFREDLVFALADRQFFFQAFTKNRKQTMSKQLLTW
jgi:hypothetical protein